MDFLIDLLFPPRETELLVRTATLEELRARKLRSYTLCARANLVVLNSLPYRDPLFQALAIEAKFHKNRRAQKLLGAALAESIFAARHWFPEELMEFVLVPIPLGKKRRRERGYNQVEEIGKEAVRTAVRAEEVGEPIRLSQDSSLLVRIRETLPQTSLSGRDRRRNMRAAFQAARPADPALLYIVFDDVCSTGATLSAACEALAEAGASFIYAVSVAY